MTRRRQIKRRRTGRSRNVEAVTERELQKFVATLRKGLGVDDSFEKAVASLRQQVIARGGDGVLRDVVCFLSEDGRSAMLAAEWGSDQPVCTNFALPIAESEFDPEFYVAKPEAARR